MSKVILILDEMPISCEMCYLSRLYEHGRFCVITKEYDHEVGRVQKNCPLKPMPVRKMHEEIIYVNDKEYLRTNAFNDYEKGYNACLDEILGEEE